MSMELCFPECFTATHHRTEDRFQALLASPHKDSVKSQANQYLLDERRCGYQCRIFA